MKIEGNVVWDVVVEGVFVVDGWCVLIIWECVFKGCEWLLVDVVFDCVVEWFVNGGVKEMIVGGVNGGF